MEDSRPSIPARGLFHAGYPAAVDVQGILAARRVVDLLGEANARDLFAILEVPEEDRTKPIAHTYLSNEGQGLANVLMDIESNPDGLSRSRLIRGLRSVLSIKASHFPGAPTGVAGLR
jgi:hypothetical protein